MLREQPSLRHAALAAVLSLSFLGTSAATDVAQAMPVAAAPAQSADGVLTAVRYHYYRRGRAGLYNCGRGALRTHLERQACGLNSRGHNGRYR